MRALLVLTMLASTAAADAPAAGPPGGGKRSPPSGSMGTVRVVGRQSYGETSLKVEAIVTRLKTVYMAGVKDCYHEALKLEPDARGRMLLRFTVSEKGHVANIETRGFNERLAECIRSRETSWTFAIPRDDDKKAVEAAFALDLAFE